MHQSIWSFNTTPIPHGNPWFFTQKAFPGGKKFEYCLGGVGNLNKKSKVFPEEYIRFNMDKIKGFRVCFPEQKA